MDVWSFLKKLKIELPYHPAIALLRIYAKYTKALNLRDICILTFIAALSTIPTLWKQPMYPLTDEWIKRIHIYNGIFFNHKKRMKSCQ